MDRTVIFLIVAVIMTVTRMDASPTDLPALSGISGLLNLAVQNAGTVQSPVNGVLKGAGLSPCDKTVELTKFVGSCIPANLKCIGVGVLEPLTKKLVNIPACGEEGPAVIVQQQQQQQTQVVK